MGTGRFYFLPALTVVWPRGSFGQSKEGTRRDGGDADVSNFLRKEGILLQVMSRGQASGWRWREQGRGGQAWV